MSDINITVNDEIVNIDVIDTPVYVEVTNSPGPAGPAGVGVPVGGTTGQVLAKTSATNYDTAWVNASGGTWGTITGTLSNQTDLQNALNAKFDDPTGTTAQYLRGDGSLATFPALTGYVPYTGATTNVDLGEYELKAGQLTLDVSPTGTAAVGATRWNDTTGVSETTLKGGNVLLRNGVDLVARVVNKVTPNTTLTKAAYQAVRVSGAQGQRLAVAFAQANNDANSADTIGLVIETIPTNQEGFIMAVGQLENINTTGSLQGETWADGDVLYLSPTIAGAITKVKPTGNGHIVVIGYVEYAHANNGKIYVKVMNGWELDELHDVSIVSVANNEALIYESSSALWKNKSIATALGYTPANAATTLTINGVTYDLSTSRTWTISAGISGTIATGQVAYATAANTIGGSNNLFWDNATGRLGIGTNTPQEQFHISNSAVLVNTVVRLSVHPNHANIINFRNSDNSVQGGFLATGSTFSYATYTANQVNLLGGSGGIGLRVANTAASSLVVYGGNLNPDFGIKYLQVYGNTGNLVLQNGGTFTDGGQRLQVYGDTLLRGSGNSSTTTALTVQNSGSTNLFTVRNDGRVGINTNAPATTFDIRGASAGIFLIRDSPEEGFIRIQTGDPTNNNGIAFRGLSNQKGFRFCDPVTAANNYMQLWASGNLTIETNTSTSYSDVASALLQVNSTTKGFLPPRMTTTQKNAIATPAAGLVLYDTTLGKLCVYTTAWETITSI